MKFQRTYRLTFEPPGVAPIIIEPPFTCEIDIQTNQAASNSNGKVRIFNLSSATRTKIHKNDWNRSIVVHLTIEAGYESTGMHTIFRGQITQCMSVRDGVNMVTTAECQQGAWSNLNSKVSYTIPAGQDDFQTIGDIMTFVPFNSPGAISPIFIGKGVSDKPRSLYDTPMQLLQNITGGACYIDTAQNRVNALANGETAEYIDAVEIDYSTGLLGTPQIENSIAVCTMLFEPKIRPGGLVVLASNTSDFLFGNYAVVGVKHRGVISPVMSGEMLTEASFYYLNEVNSIDSFSKAASAPTT